MKKLIKTLTLILFASFVILILPTQSKSQSGTFTRTLDSSAFVSAGYWYDSTNSMFQIQYPVIKTKPPLNTGMPYDILLSYIYLDSLLRFSTSFEQDSLLDTWSSVNDTLGGAITYWYKLVDYDPVIFNQYMGEVALNNVSVSGGSYTSNLYYLRNAVARKIKSLVEPSEKNAIFALLYADYILKVEVIDIDSTADKRKIDGFDDSNAKRYKVQAYVLDTIKGKRFTDINPPGSENMRKNDDYILTYENPVIEFQYINDMYYQRTRNVNDSYKNIENDSTFMNANGGFEMQTGQTAVVFIRHTNQLFDYQYDYFDLDLESMCSNNALPIIEGNVRDINKIWSDNVLQSYESWKQDAEQLIQKILDGSY